MACSRIASGSRWALPERRSYLFVPKATRIFVRSSALESPTLSSHVADIASISGLQEFFDGLKFDANGLVPVIVQNVDSGEIAMQAYADKAAISETLQTGLATFYSRSRKGRWCKGETSGNFIHVKSIHFDCDRDCFIYMSVPVGPSCHTGAKTCWFQSVKVEGDAVQVSGDHHSTVVMPRTSLQELEYTISQRKQQASLAQPGEKPSWTARLMADENLLCKKIKEEAGELCQAVQENEGRERTVSEAADLLYHALVLLGKEEIPLEDVAAELRRRFGVSGVEEKSSRKN